MSLIVVNRGVARSAAVHYRIPSLLFAPNLITSIQHLSTSKTKAKKAFQMSRTFEGSGVEEEEKEEEATLLPFFSSLLSSHVLADV